MHDVGELQIGETTVILEAVPVAEGVTVLDDLEETVIATLSAPRLQAEAETEIESETEAGGRGRGCREGRGGVGEE